MNDLQLDGADLRKALSRDADLVGALPDLLGQLARRRRHQRMQRAGMFAGVAAVAVIAAGIPVVSTLVSRADGGPATQTTVAPTPSPAEPAPASSAVPVTPSPTPPLTTASSAPVTAAPSAPADSQAPSSDPACDWTAIYAAPSPDTTEVQHTPAPGQGELCSGSWAAAGYTDVITDAGGEQHSDGQAGLFHYVGGARAFLRPSGSPPATWTRDIGPGRQPTHPAVGAGRA